MSVSTPTTLPGRFEDRLLNELLEVVAERRLTAGPIPAPASMSAMWWQRLRQRWIGLLALAIVVTSGTALAATTPWNTPVGNERDGHPSRAITSLPDRTVALLATLRRPQTDADRGPRVREALKLLPRQEFSNVNVASARLLQSWPGGAAILLVAEHAGATGKGPLCLVVSSDYGIRNGTRVREPSAGQACGAVDDLKAGRLFMGSAIGSHLQLTGIVPDGIARVEVPLKTGQTVRADVIDNAFRIDTQIPRGSYEDTAIRWVDGNGEPVGKNP